ncbi:MAG: SDR family NAD(P)-dependent oxidoreductase, partial [Terriglobia bacterium]
MSAKALAGQVALVTGAGRRLGQAIALALARAGARVAVGYHTSEAGARDTVRQIEECGGQAVAIKADVSRPDEIKRLVAAAEERLGAPDILVNNAGIFER